MATKNKPLKVTEYTDDQIESLKQQVRTQTIGKAHDIIREVKFSNPDDDTLVSQLEAILNAR